MAGLRVGYICIRDEELLENYKNAELLLSVSHLQVAAASRLVPQIDLAAVRLNIGRMKSEVMSIISQFSCLTVSDTHQNVPIFSMTWSESANLYEKLMDEGIRTEPGKFFGIGDNTVRLRVPAAIQLDVFAESLTRLFGGA